MLEPLVSSYCAKLKIKDVSDIFIDFHHPYILLLLLLLAAPSVLVLESYLYGICFLLTVPS